MHPAAGYLGDAMSLVGHIQRVARRVPSRHSGCRFAGLLAALALVLAQSLMAFAPASAGQSGAAPPCHVEVGAPADIVAGDHVSGHVDPNGGASPCPMMNGASCLTLCAAAVPSMVVAMVAIPGADVEPGPEAMHAPRPVAPDRRPPRSP